jgi:hypothetical protein
MANHAVECLLLRLRLAAALEDGCATTHRALARASFTVTVPNIFGWLKLSHMLLFEDGVKMASGASG